MNGGGRVTADRLNACLDELCQFAEGWSVKMQLAKQRSAKVSDREMQYLRDILLNVAQAPSVKGRPFCLDTDLKRGQHTKQDHTGKAVLMALRHLGRLAEVKCQLTLSDLSMPSVSVLVLL